jgi:hypothetical protein
VRKGISIEGSRRFAAEATTDCASPTIFSAVGVFFLRLVLRVVELPRVFAVAALPRVPSRFDVAFFAAFFRVVRLAIRVSFPMQRRLFTPAAPKRPVRRSPYRPTTNTKQP